jgi:phosphate transport system substrate-binding protein
MPARILFTIAVIMSCMGRAQADDMKVGGTGAANGLLLRLSEAFHAASPGDRIEVVAGLGSSGALAAAAEGAVGLAVVSRCLTADETAKGLVAKPLLHTPFLFVTSHPDPQVLTKAAVVAIYDGTLIRWPDGKEIRPILRPKSDSATSFLIDNFEGIQAAMDKLRQRMDVPIAATDQDNIEAAVTVANSFAGTTLTQLMTERPPLRPIALNGIHASVTGMELGAYKLKMRLDAVIKSTPSPVAQRFAAFLHSPEAGKIIRENGGAPLTARTAYAQ